MKDDGYLISPGAMRRISQVVKTVERGGGACGGPPEGTGRQPNVPYQQKWYRIVSNPGGGAYTVRLQRFDTASKAFIDIDDSHNPEYGVNQDAWDFHSYDHGYVDQLVPGWRVWFDWHWYIVLDVNTMVGDGRLTGGLGYPDPSCSDPGCYPDPIAYPTGDPARMSCASAFPDWDDSTKSLRLGHLACGVYIPGDWRYTVPGLTMKLKEIAGKQYLVFTPIQYNLDVGLHVVAVDSSALDAQQIPLCGGGGGNFTLCLCGDSWIDVSGCDFSGGVLTISVKHQGPGATDGTKTIDVVNIGNAGADGSADLGQNKPTFDAKGHSTGTAANTNVSNVLLNLDGVKVDGENIKRTADNAGKGITIAHDVPGAEADSQMLSYVSKAPDGSIIASNYTLSRDANGHLRGINYGEYQPLFPADCAGYLHNDGSGTLSWDAAMQGPKGDQGDQGDPGCQGPQGEPGPQGDPGPKGDKGDQGDKGDPGCNGCDGCQGPQGDPGPKGDKGDPGCGVGVWGQITGTLSDQTDLQNALNNLLGAIVGDSTWISVDTCGGTSTVSHIGPTSCDHSLDVGCGLSVTKDPSTGFVTDVSLTCVIGFDSKGHQTSS